MAMAARPRPSEQERNLKAYNRQRAELEAHHRGEYVAVANGEVLGWSSSLDEAMRIAEPFAHKLVFQIGTEPVLSPLRALSGRKLGRIVD